VLGAEGPLALGEHGLEERDGVVRAAGRVSGGLTCTILLGHIRAPAFDDQINDPHASAIARNLRAAKNATACDTARSRGTISMPGFASIHTRIGQPQAG